MNKGRDLKPHIGIFGRRNFGKSSFINVLVNQDVAIVSELPGTTTDPVKKSIEIFGIGPAVIIDTAGIDDVGELGEKRIQKTIQILGIIDCAILMIAENKFGSFEIDLIRQFADFDIPFVIIHNKSDKEPLSLSTIDEIRKFTQSEIIDFSSLHPTNLDEVVHLLKKTIPESLYQDVTLFKGLLEEKDVVVLVTPIDKEAPDGRLILPQVMAIRDILDHHCINVVLQEAELEYFLKTSAIKPKMVVTDSQAFSRVSKIVPPEIPLTGFSILFARLKGNFDAYLQGTLKISELKDGDKVLIMESCSHHVNCDDIGRFKLPSWLQEFTGKKLEFEVVSSFDKAALDIHRYALVIQCGGCMFTRKQVLNRLKPAIEQGIPVSNYGLAISYTQGIFKRAIEIFK
jgi:[FeFe] hydrogenase H-cluster maturation GTPase HydF